MNTAEIINAIATVSEKRENGEIDEQAFSNTIEALNVELGDKLDAMAWIVEDLSKDLAVYEAEKKRLSDVAKSIKSTKSRISNLKHYMAKLLEMADQRKVRTDKHVFTSRGYRQPVIMDDETAVPNQYFEVVTTRKLDSQALYTALKAGEEIPGAHLGENRQIVIK